METYAGSGETVLQCLHRHFKLFVDNGMIKKLLPGALQHLQNSAPKPNNLPSSYEKAKNLLEPYLIFCRELMHVSLTVFYTNYVLMGRITGNWILVQSAVHQDMQTPVQKCHVSAM